MNIDKKYLVEKLSEKDEEIREEENRHKLFMERLNKELKILNLQLELFELMNGDIE